MSIRHRLLRGTLAAVVGLAVLAPAAIAQTPPAPPAPSVEDRKEFHRATANARRLLRRMTLEEKIGQMFVPYVYGAEADAAHPANPAKHGVDTPAEVVAEYHLGGVIYFAWSGNLVSPRQVSELSNGLQSAALESGARVPLLISTDQEQGVVERLPQPSTRYPGTMALGAARDPLAAHDAAQVTGEELRAAGINQVFAPVADVNVNPQNPVIGVRSFGADPGMVSGMVSAQVAGFRRADVAATAKHFPGHGDTATDSHLGLPVIEHTREEFEALDLPPFQAAIDAGVDAVMTAHILVPSLDDSGLPATLSEPILTGWLRERLDYDGLIVTDALDMDGVRGLVPDDRVPVEAIKAGADLMLMPVRLADTIANVAAAVEAGEISEARIDRSVERILVTKYERGLFDDPYVDVDAVEEVVAAPEHQAHAQAVADRTVTLVRNDDGILPLDPGGIESVLVTGWGQAGTATLRDAIAAEGVAAEALWTGEPDAERIDEAVRAAADHDVAVVATMSAGFAPSAPQRDLVAALEAGGTPVVVVAVRNPYDVASLPGVGTYLAAYSYAPVSLRATARVLFGTVDPSGTLPVTIPAANDPAAVLHPYGHGLRYGAG